MLSSGSQSLPANLTLFSPSYAIIHPSSWEVAFCSIRSSAQGANHETQGSGKET